MDDSVSKIIFTQKPQTADATTSCLLYSSGSSSSSASDWKLTNLSVRMLINALNSQQSSGRLSNLNREILQVSCEGVECYFLSADLIGNNLEGVINRVEEGWQIGQSSD